MENRRNVWYPGLRSASTLLLKTKCYHIYPFFLRHLNNKKSKTLGQLRWREGLVTRKVIHYQNTLQNGLFLRARADSDRPVMSSTIHWQELLNSVCLIPSFKLKPQYPKNVFKMTNLFVFLFSFDTHGIYHLSLLFTVNQLSIIVLYLICF